MFILLAGGNGWGNGFGGFGGFGGGSEIYPWMNQSNQINDGFRDQMINGNVTEIRSGVTGLATQLCNCCGDIQTSLCNGFAGVNSAISNGFSGAEIAANGRQMANMNQAFAAQTAMAQGFNGLQAQLAQCGCDNRLATEGLKYTIATENCADRAALSDGIRDLLANQTASTQRILDQLCQDKIDAKNDEIAQLRQELNMKTLAASQASQTAAFQQGLNNEVDALYNRLSNCPVPSVPVYGRQPIFTCRDNSCGCGCGNGSF